MSIVKATYANRIKLDIEEVRVSQKLISLQKGKCTNILKWITIDIVVSMNTLISFFDKVE